MKAKKAIYLVAFGAGIALVGFCETALAVGTGLPFTVSEGVVPQTAPGGPFAAPNNFVANSLDFSYNATVTGGNLASPPASFDESGFFEGSSYKNGVSTPPQQLNSLAPNGYGLYGVFTLQGTAVLTGPTAITATFATGTLDLFLDTNQDTTKVLPALGTGTTTLGNIADDVKVGSASLIGAGQAHVFIGLANGDFEAVWGDWTLTAFGSTYWPAPSPFYMIVDANGNTTTITPPPTLGGSTSTFDGSGNAFFIPEPGSLALSGLALTLAGFVSRRRKGR